MKTLLTKPHDIDDYISRFPIATQKSLQQLRKTIRKAAPQATEVISYGMPAFKLNSVLVYFAAYERHIGFYPTPSAILTFKKEFSDYYTSKGAVQFPLGKPLPLVLITNVVKLRVSEDHEKAKEKKTKKK